ncbi:MAG: hypothetical protein GY858_06065 [Candidatus Omnitrophica bacterium]|nr:hypothetical protein [Candidatus Omnitrophota bacterium]
MLIRKKAQGILEYTLLLGAIIAVVVTVMMKKDSGVAARVKKTYEKAGTAIDKTNKDLNVGVFAPPASTVPGEVTVRRR